MSEVKIASELRDQFGKGAARKIRRADRVPVVLYGHGTEPVTSRCPGTNCCSALRTPNVLIRIEGAVDELALPKGVQRDPIKGFLEHVDLILVRRGEKVTIEMPVTVSGDVVNGAILDQQLRADLGRGRGDQPADRCRDRRRRQGRRFLRPRR